MRLPVWYSCPNSAGETLHHTTTAAPVKLSDHCAGCHTIYVSGGHVWSPPLSAAQSNFYSLFQRQSNATDAANATPRLTRRTGADDVYEALLAQRQIRGGLALASAFCSVFREPDPRKSWDYGFGEGALMDALGHFGHFKSRENSADPSSHVMLLNGYTHLHCIMHIHYSSRALTAES